jgi:hypothetical protein
MLVSRISMCLGSLAERGAERHAEHVGERESGEHQRDGLRAAVRRDEIGGDDRADAEERAVAESGDDARAHQHPVVRRQRAQQVADDEHADQAHQRLLARHLCGDHRQNRRADRDAERVARHEHAGRRNRHREIARDVGQQSHDDEFGRADAERGNGESEKRQRHGGGGRGVTSGRIVGVSDAGAEAELKARIVPKGHFRCWYKP